MYWGHNYFSTWSFSICKLSDKLNCRAYVILANFKFFQVKLIFDSCSIFNFEIRLFSSVWVNLFSSYFFFTFVDSGKYKWWKKSKRFRNKYLFKIYNVIRINIMKVFVQYSEIILFLWQIYFSWCEYLKRSCFLHKT